MRPLILERTETIAFSRFVHNYDQASSYLNLTEYFNFDQLPSSGLVNRDGQPLSKSEKATFDSLVATARMGRFIAAKLAVVYIVTIMETYIKDALLELVKREQRALVIKLEQAPEPMNKDEVLELERDPEELEDEMIMADILRDNAMDDETHPAFRLGHLSAEYIALRMSRESLIEGVRLLKKYFGVRILDESKRLRGWNDLKKLRNLIVHYADSEEASAVYFNIAPKVCDRTIAFSFLVASMDQAFEFAKAIEEGIYDSVHGAEKGAK